MNATSVKGFVILTLEFHKEDRSWVGVCRELGVAADGRSLEKLKQHLLDLVTVHLNGLEGIGALDRVFQERGIRIFTDDVPTTIEATLPVDDATLVEATRVPVEVSGYASVPA